MRASIPLGYHYALIGRVDRLRIKIPMGYASLKKKARSVSSVRVQLSIEISSLNLPIRLAIKLQLEFN